jgi:hypothetical protein
MQWIRTALYFVDATCFGLYVHCFEYYAETCKPFGSSLVYCLYISSCTFVCGPVSSGGCRAFGAMFGFRPTFVRLVPLHEVSEDGKASECRADFAHSALYTQFGSCRLSHCHEQCCQYSGHSWPPRNKIADTVHTGR